MAVPVALAEIEAKRFVTATSRYAESQVLLYGKDRLLTFASYKRKPYVPSDSDRFAVVPPGEEYRPDLTAFRAYGIVDYWWLLMEVNNFAGFGKNDVGGPIASFWLGQADSAVNPMHIAFALEIPTVALFGPVRPDLRVRPRSIAKHKILYKPTVESEEVRRITQRKKLDNEAMQSISVEEVLAAIKMMLNKTYFYDQHCLITTKTFCKKGIEE